MPATLGSMRSLVKADIGGREDTTALLVMDHGINVAILLATILFKPIEMRVSLNTSYTGSAEYVDLSTYRWLDISKVRDITNNFDLRFIPFDLIDRIVNSNLNSVKYYSLFGNNLYLRKIPTVNIGIRIYYLKEPVKLVNSTDAFPFDGYDGFIRTVASALVFAAFEETDSVNMWTSLSSQLTGILSVGVDNKATFGSVKSYLDQMIGITQGQGAVSGK